MSLSTACRELGISQLTLSREAQLGKGTVSRLMAGHWPKRDTADVRARVGDVLRRRGATNDQLRAVLPTPAAAAKENAPQVAAREAFSSAPVEINQNPTEKEPPMLLQFQALTPATLQHFKLPRSPFVNDLQSRADVYQSPATRYARSALMDAAANHGFVAIVGESGAGKTTMLAEMQQRLIDEGRDKEIIVIKPHVLAMEASDTKGKTLRSTHIAEAIAFKLDPALKIKSSPEARFGQLEALLRDSRRGGRRHLLVIEEAHCLPIATLKHLKRFLELVDGMSRLIGVALIAQPELRNLLESQNPEVREVMQRCEVIDLPPLDNELENYVAHKFKRFELKPEDVFTPDAFNALRARLVSKPRGWQPGDSGAVSSCYPLAVQNLIARAMNAACVAQYPKVDASVVTHC